MSAPPHRVLVTGSAGRVGRAVVAALTAAGHRVIGFDLTPTPGLPPADAVVGTLTDGGALRRAADGATRLIHLAATPDDAHYPRRPPPADDDNFLADLVPNNLVGGYHVLEAARRCGVPRAVLASSSQVTFGYLKDGDVPAVVGRPTRPRYLYACTKVFLEAVGQAYAAEHGLEVLAARIGWLPRADQLELIAGYEFGPDLYLSPADAGRAFVAAVEAPAWGGFRAVYVASRPASRALLDLGPAERLLGYVPRDTFPDGLTDGV